MKHGEDIQSKMNAMGKMREPFAFLIDFKNERPLLFSLDNVSDEIWWQIPGFSNIPASNEEIRFDKWEYFPVTFEEYKTGYDLIKQHISNGDTYLLNYTQPTLVKSNLLPHQIFRLSKAPYKIFLKNEFVCFSPETFVKIKDGKISAFPMKGTIDADIENAKEIVLTDSKEIAEHNTIVDLIRNDLSLVAENVTVEKFRYLDFIQTHNKNLWQVSSKITGELPLNYHEKIGDILFAMLPAGSVTGAPKTKTLEIIDKVENYNRGYYTGVFGIFDGFNLDSCVLIRFIEINGEKLIYKSGGGITFMSDAPSEYDELLKKIYVPLA